MHTKKTSLFFINVVVITILSCIANIAFAQTATNTSSSSTAGATTSTSLVPKTESADTTSEVPTQKSELSEEKRIRLTNLIANISNRIEAGLERLETIVRRFESRSKKLESEGYNLGNTKLHLSEATTALTEARVGMETIDTQVNLMVNGDNPLESWKKIRQTLVDGALQLQHAKEFLFMALTQMKSAELKVNEATINTTATTSSETNTVQLVN